jgi:hypothetical protein
LEIRVLGAHSSESLDTCCSCFIIDNSLAVEAGALASRLSMDEQQAIKDIPSIALNFFRSDKCFDLYSTSQVCDILQAHLLNNVVYPEFQKIPEKKPTINLIEVEPYGLQWIDGHSILPIPVKHAVPTVGYEITDKLGNAFFYTGDTGPGLAECWEHISPQLLIIDVTLPDSCEQFACKTGHLTPCLLEKELISFREIKGYLPDILAIHMDIARQGDIQEQLATVAKNLDANINIASEGMRLLF